MSRIRFIRSGIAACAIATTGLIISDPVAAREEIVVTAKGREQSLYDVPLSISVVDEERIEQLGITTLDDLDRWVPSLDIRTPSGRRSSTIVMRGLSPNTTNEQLRGVSVFVDGIYQSGSIASLKLQDLERVEVVRGPQSAMFGRSTYTGAIDLVTRTPKVDDLTGKFGGSYSQYSVGSTPKYDLSGRLDFPIMADKLWGSVSGSYSEVESFAGTPSGSTGVGGEETTAFGLVLYAEPMDNLSVKFRYNRAEDRDDTAMIHTTAPDEWIANGVATTVLGNGHLWPSGEVMHPIEGTTECQPNYDRSSTSTAGVLDGTINPETGSVGRGSPLDCGENQDRDFASLIVEYDMSGYEVSYRGSWFRSELQSNNDFIARGNVDGLGFDPFFGAGNGVYPGGKSAFAFLATEEDFENYSHQVRIISPDEQRLRWLAGLYYFDEKNTNYSVDNFTPRTSHSGSITALDNVHRIVDRGPDDLENIAAFGQIEFDIIDELTASLEARFQRETIEKKQCPDCRLASFGDDNGYDLKESENEFLPRVTLTWQPSETQTYYVLYSEGTKSGRFNTSEPTGFVGNFADFVYVEPEDLQNYEIGAKNSFWDDRVQTSLSVFYLDVEDQQQTAQLPLTTQSFTQNVGESTVWGFEFEAFAGITENITANLGIGVADHEYDTDFIPGSSLDRAILDGDTMVGKRSVGVPKTTISGGIEYATAVMTGYDLLVRLDATYRSKAYVDIANKAWVGDNTQVNLLTNFGTEIWTISLFARNLNNDKTSPGNFSGTSSCSYRNAALTTFTSPSQRCSGLGVSRGREVGIGAVWNF